MCSVDREQIYREILTYTGRQGYRDTGDMVIQRDRYTEIQEIQTDTWRQIYRDTEIQEIQTDTGRQTYRETDRHGVKGYRDTGDIVYNYSFENEIDFP